MAIDTWVLEGCCEQRLQAPLVLTKHKRMLLQRSKPKSQHAARTTSNRFFMLAAGGAFPPGGKDIFTCLCTRPRCDLHGEFSLIDCAGGLSEGFTVRCVTQVGDSRDWI